MNCGYCKDCKWWGNKTVSDKARACLVMDAHPPLFLGFLVNQKGRIDSGLPVMTQPEFGCVQFEAKA